MQLSGSHQAVIRQTSGSYNFVRQSKKSPVLVWKVQWQFPGSHQATIRQSEKAFFSLVSKQTLPEWTKAKTPMRTSEIRRSIFLGENSGKLKENSGKLWTNSGSFFRQITARNMASRRCKVLIPKEAVPRCTGLRTSFG
jgi:hypothetical protein